MSRGFGLWGVRINSYQALGLHRFLQLPPLCRYHVSTMDEPAPGYTLTEDGINYLIDMDNPERDNGRITFQFTRTAIEIYARLNNWHIEREAIVEWFSDLTEDQTHIIEADQQPRPGDTNVNRPCYDGNFRQLLSQRMNLDRAKGRKEKPHSYASLRDVKGGGYVVDPAHRPLVSQRTSPYVQRPLGEMLTSVERGLTAQVDVTKVGRGSFNTKGASWLNPVVKDFIKEAKQRKAVDPFAGEGDMLSLCKSEFGMETLGYDINRDFSENLGWTLNDSLKNIPDDPDAICVTNPPFLANYSAKRKSMWEMVGDYFEESSRSDLYEIALDRCLESFDYVVAIVPETFVHSTFPRERCLIIVILEDNPFEDTTFPVCVTCWGPSDNQDPEIYVGEKRIMRHTEMVEKKGSVSRNKRVIFNDPKGNIGLKAVDGTKIDDRIRFIPGDDFDYPRSSIKISSRLMTYLSIPELTSEREISDFCSEANQILERYREGSEDIILSGFKGNNKEGRRRRRLDYRLARRIILEAL